MKIAVFNANVITGDGKTVHRDSCVVIEDGIIREVKNTPYLLWFDAGRTIDAKGGYVIPGLINHHTHGVAFGPYGEWGTTPLPRERVIENLNKHLLQGETTVVNACGWPAYWDVELVNKIHPINVRVPTLNTPSNLKSAELQDGRALTEEYKKLTAREMLSLGAVAVGEVGNSVIYSQLLERKLGRIDWAKLDFETCTLIVETIAKKPDEKQIKDMLKRVGLESDLTVKDVKDLEDDYFKFYKLAVIDGLREAADLAKEFNVPVICHHDHMNTDGLTPFAKELGPLLIASHSNECIPKENALKRARELKRYGALIDVACEDSFGAKRFDYEGKDIIFAMLKENLVDLIETDYIGGFWDPILLVLEKAIEEQVIDLPRAIALATGNVAKAIPRAAPGRGFIAPGKIADLAVVNRENISKVDAVIIGGRIVVENGELAIKPANWS